MDSFLELMKNVNFESVASVIGVLFAVIYKIIKVLKESDDLDIKNNPPHSYEYDFNRVLLVEVEKLRKEREELIKASIPVEKRLFKLESNCASLKSYCRKTVAILKVKDISSDPDFIFLIKKGEELIETTNSSRSV